MSEAQASFCLINNKFAGKQAERRRDKERAKMKWKGRNGCRSAEDGRRGNERAKRDRGERGKGEEERRLVIKSRQ